MIIGLEEKDINEIGIISQLDSQYVTKYYEHFKDDVFVYLVIEYGKVFYLTENRLFIF